jgi:hypothetical protein
METAIAKADAEQLASMARAEFDLRLGQGCGIGLTRQQRTREVRTDHKTRPIAGRILNTGAALEALAGFGQRCLSGIIEWASGFAAGKHRPLRTAPANVLRH